MYYTTVVPPRSVEPPRSLELPAGVRLPVHGEQVADSVCVIMPVKMRLKVYLTLHEVLNIPSIVYIKKDIVHTVITKRIPLRCVRPLHTFIKTSYIP